MEEEWRSIRGYEGLYEVSNFGRVRSLDHLDRLGKKCRGVIRSLSGKGRRYTSVTLCKNGVLRTKQVHQLVAVEFIGEPPVGMQVNHIDGNKRNNRFDNLEYLTSLENNRHAWRIGIARCGSLKGDASPRAKVTDAQVVEIRTLFATGKYTGRQIAKLFNIGKSQVWNIVSRKQRV